MEVFLGIPAADGVGVGTAFVIPEAVKRAIPQKRIRKEETAEGWERFQSSIRTVTTEITSQLENLPKTIKANDTQREIFETYILMLEDPVFLAELKNEYEKTLYSIEHTIDVKAEEYASRLRNAGNEYLAERAQDISDVFGRVLDDMMDIHLFDINRVPDGAVIVAETLSPTDTIILSKRKIAGLALTEGGVSSHVVILARNYGIPTVVGLNNITRQIHTGDKVIVDGRMAEVLTDPDIDTLVEYENRIAAAKKHEESLKSFLDKPAQTKDGTSFKLYANIGTPEEAEHANAEGADGIGLFRTEFLYMSTTGGTGSSAARSFDEDTQFEAYKRVLETMNGKPVTIRTLDAGGDKLINSVDIPALAEKNPLMGLRAVRLSLAYPQILKTQLRSLYRASIYGDLRIMLPLITSVEQVNQCKVIAGAVREELCSENIPFNENVPIGIMVETAAAAVASDCLARQSAFFSLGTNDLTQYTLGVDRENSAVSDLYDEFNLAVLRLIAATIDNAKKSGIDCAVCGEMAGRSDSVLVLAGMGIRSLSMSPKLISGVKELLSRFTIDELQSISAKHLNNL
jgi:phosphoenolpyruvate-protein phosphotransferase (PTS system enzyme I)